MAMKASPLQPPFLPRVYYSALVDTSPNGVILEVSVGWETKREAGAKSKADKFIEKSKHEKEPAWGSKYRLHRKLTVGSKADSARADWEKRPVDDSETSGTSDSTDSDSESALLEGREKEEAELVDDDGDDPGPAGGHGHDDDDDTSSGSSAVDVGDLPPVSFDQVGLQNFEVTPSANLRAKCFTCGNGFSPGGLRFVVRTKPGASMTNNRCVHTYSGCLLPLPERPRNIAWAARKIAELRSEAQFR